MTKGLATLADDDCVILLVKRNGKWFMYEGGQEIDHALGREQPPRDRIDLHDLSFLDEWPKQKRLNPKREQTTMEAFQRLIDAQFSLYLELASS
jgi:hypothetical protein